MASRASNKADRIFVQDGRRHYRRRFSAAEVRVGVFILFFLGLIVAWVAWKGAHPDPALFRLDTDLAQGGSAGASDRGPVPEGLALAGWSEGDVSRFDPDNLYVKIDGREGYYKSFGFEMLYFMSIVSDEDPQRAVDIELYDLGTAANAVGAYSGERSPGAESQAGESGLGRLERNALYLTHGRYYLRAIGSEESPQVTAQLEALRDRFEQALPGEPLPWGITLFVAGLGMDPGAIAYSPENAFSFGFAREVYSATLADESDVFVTPARGESAQALAERYRDGFRQYGEDDGSLIRDRYQSTYATAVAAGPWVVGFRGATDTEAALGAMNELADVVRDRPLPDAPAGSTLDAVEETYDDGQEQDEY